MRTTITFLAALIMWVTTFSQRVGIGNASPHTSAVLDITSTNRGLLIPRMTTTAINSISNPAKGLMIYDSVKNQLMVNMGSTSVPNWQTIVFNSGWNLTGNSGASAAGNFIGTIDNNPLQFRINNNFAGKIDSARYGTFLGYGAGKGDIGSSNTAFGFNAYNANASGAANTAIGREALSSNTTAFYNVAIGNMAMKSNTVGIANVGAGNNSLFSNISGGSNTAVGSSSLYNNISGGVNVAIGESALFENTTGSNNTAVGYGALENNGIGSGNTALGVLSGHTTAADPSNFTAIGYRAGWVGGATNTIEIGNTSVIWNGGNVGWSTYSDARIKTDVKEEVVGLDFITRLRPVTYYRSNDAMKKLIGIKDTFEYAGKNDIEKIKFSGFIAQEVEAAAKAAGYDFSGITVPTTDKQIYSLRYEQFVVPLVKGMQEQQAEIADLKNEIEVLKGQNKMLVQLVNKKN